MSVVAQTPAQLQTATSESTIQSPPNNDLPCIKKLETMITDLSNCDINTPVTDDEKTEITNKLTELKTMSQLKIDSLAPKKGFFGLFGGKKSKKSKKSKSKTKKQRR